VLGGTYRLPHASVHSVLLPQVAAFNAPAAPDAFGRAARALGADRPDEVGAALFELADQIGAPTALADLGLPVDALESVVQTIADAQVPNPREFGSDDLAWLLQQAYWGRKRRPYEGGWSA
jgi:maleylacetate reductase